MPTTVMEIKNHMRNLPMLATSSPVAFTSKFSTGISPSWWPTCKKKCTIRKHFQLSDIKWLTNINCAKLLKQSFHYNGILCIESLTGRCCSSHGYRRPHMVWWHACLWERCVDRLLYQEQTSLTWPMKRWGNRWTALMMPSSQAVIRTLSVAATMEFTASGWPGYWSLKIQQLINKYGAPDRSRWSHNFSNLEPEISFQ